MFKLEKGYVLIEVATHSGLMAVPAVLLPSMPNLDGFKFYVHPFVRQDLSLDARSWAVTEESTGLAVYQDQLGSRDFVIKEAMARLQAHCPTAAEMKRWIAKGRRYRRKIIGSKTPPASGAKPS